MNSKYVDNSEILKVGKKVIGWKADFKEYKNIQGILIDVKILMNINVQQEIKEIEKMAELIESDS